MKRCSIITAWLVVSLNSVSRALSSSWRLVEIPDEYITSEPPSVPVKVHLSYYVSEIVNVDDKKNEFEVEGDLTLTWVDPRLRLSNSSSGVPDVDDDEEVLMDLKYREKIWTPDIWIESLRGFNIHKSLKQHVSLSFYPSNNGVSLWQSTSIRTSCPMNFKFYPFDSQQCRIRFSSNGLDVSMQVFEGAIEMAEFIHFSQGALQHTDIEVIQDKNLSFLSDSKREWPQVQAKFLMKRRKLDHVLQTFQPTGCLVCLSWISFLIPPYIVPGRMVLLVTLLLVVFGTYQNEHERSPRSSSLKAVDVWFLACMIFVLIAIFEYAVVLLMKRIIIKQRRLQEQQQQVRESSNDGQGDTKSTIFSPSDNEDTESTRPRERNARTINVKFADSSVKVPRSAITSRYRSATNRIHVSPSPGNTLTDVKHPSMKSLGMAVSFASKVLDSGSEYGDINETDMDGEELLEKIDERALLIVPVLFLIFNIAYWCHYLLIGKETSEKDAEFG